MCMKNHTIKREWEKEEVSTIRTKRIYQKPKEHSKMMFIWWHSPHTLTHEKLGSLIALKGNLSSSRFSSELIISKKNNKGCVDSFTLFIQ